MKNLEEQIWDFIDGNLSEAESQKIQHLINSDQEVKKMHQNFLNFNKLNNTIDLEEPSMSFTRNVMDDIAKVPAPILLKTKVDNRIIYSIAAFFGVALLGALILAIYNSITEQSSFQLDLNFSTNFFENKTLLSAFLFADVIVALLFIDSLLRNKLRQREKSAH